MESKNDTPYTPEYASIQIEGGPDMFTLAVVISDLKEIPCVANARLIAAAPDLYDALKDFVEWSQESYPYSLSEPLNSILINARAALAKADGKTETI